MTELVQRSTDFVGSALLEHLRFESNVEARALTQQPRGQQWRVIRVSGDMLCGFLEFGEGNRHGGSLRSRVRRRFVRRPTSAVCFFPFPKLFDRIEADDLLPARRLRARFARQGSEFLGDSQTFCRSPGEVSFEPFEPGGFEWV